MSLLDAICHNEAGWPYACLCWPFVLLWNATYVYILSCIWIMLGRFKNILCYPFVACCCTWVYTDDSFHGKEALGEDVEVDWVRADELASMEKDGRPGTMKLYEGKVEPKDLVQGAVGDCWLVAALSSASEHPACIRKAFLTPERNVRGSYRVRLFDGQQSAWVTVKIDDRIPCAKGTKTPLYCKNHGNELWAILIEKAFAKFCGSYKALDGGFASWAWRALTGDTVFRLKCVDGRVWQRLDFKNETSAKDKRECGFYVSEEKYTPDEAWVLIQKYLRADCLVAASGGEDMSGGGGSRTAGAGLNGESTADNGLVGTHAYSVLDGVELGLIPGVGFGSGLLGKTKLIKLRNPWGSFEWKGAWSDNSKEWGENPIVRARLRPNKDDNDGSFWMPIEEFSKIFTKVDFCDRTTKRDLKLQVHEGWGSCGLVAGCLGGLANFFCLCKGLRVIYCGQSSSSTTKSAKRNCFGCVGGPLGGAPDEGLEVV